MTRANRCVIACVAVAGIAAGACHRTDDKPGVPPRADATVELCGAYPYQPAKTHAVVIDSSGTAGDIVGFHDHSFNVHRTDCLKLVAGDIQDVRWRVDGPRFFIGVRGVGPAAERIGERSEKRTSQYDATYINGDLYTVALYENVLSDTVWLSDTDRAGQAKFYERLTGVPPPP